jgi:hypothetical protein
MNGSALISIQAGATVLGNFMNWGRIGLSERPVSAAWKCLKNE